MNLLLARLKCWLYGHKRGKRMSTEEAFRLANTGPASTGQVNAFKCPRCLATWTRKA